MNRRTFFALILASYVAAFRRIFPPKPDENNYIASYKELGIERGVSFTAQFAGEGFADNLADEHLRGLHELWLQEEGIILAQCDYSDLIDKYCDVRSLEPVA